MKHREAKNTDREIWRANPDSYYSPSIHVTEDKLIGINVGGHVIVMSIDRWHELGAAHLDVVRLKQPNKGQQ